MKIILPHFLQDLTGGGASPTPTPLAYFPEINTMPLLPIADAIICAAGGFLGSCAKIAQENKRSTRSTRENLLNFFICATFGISISLSGGEWIFRTQPWARSSIWWLLGLAVVLGYNGQLIALESPAAIKAAWDRVIWQGKNK